ncbi:MAG: alpha/beta hydrolase [Gammaproteobacteria bacterium]
MALHPQAQAIVDAANAAGVPFEATDHHALRSSYAAATRLYVHPTPTLASVEDLAFPGPADARALRLYRPERAASTSPAPALVFFHGGGWVVGDLDSHDHLCRYLAAEAGVALVAVDYRLAPEHRFPAAFDDAVAATRWVAREASRLGLDAARIAVGGDSAGGNLAAGVALTVRGEIDLAHQLLIYPAVDFSADNASLRDNATGYMLTTRAMEQFADWYLGDAALKRDWRASPALAADHAGIAPATVITAGYDPLRDEALAYAEALRAAGVAVESRNYADMIHGFARMGGLLDTAREALDYAASRLRAALAP